MVMSCALFQFITHASHKNLSRIEDGENYDTEKMVKNDFEMPIHYPRYNKEDYAKMEEYMVDLLLKQYGLRNHVNNGTLEQKKRLAVDTFVA
ncbi:hypothetical protein vseg_000957 [Gypsophila vaccaria]